MAEESRQDLGAASSHTVWDRRLTKDVPRVLGAGDMVSLPFWLVTLARWAR